MNDNMYDLAEVINKVTKEIVDRQMNGKTDMTIMGDNLVALLGHFTCPNCQRKFMSEADYEDHLLAEQTIWEVAPALYYN